MIHRSLGGFGREFGVRAPGFDGAAGSAKLRKNADRATLLHITIAVRQYVDQDRHGRRTCRPSLELRGDSLRFAALPALKEHLR
jgi:hypothetical protein